MITVYTLVYNEEILMQYFINWYRSRFPGCRIIVNDNASTDRTVEICKANNCEVRPYDAHQQLDDGLHMRMKNTMWKDANTDWVLLCDLDEMLDITEEQLKVEEAAGVTRIKTEAWTMVNLIDDTDLESLAEIDQGFRDSGYDKSVLFNKKFIHEINYAPGCHSSNPIGHVIDSTKTYQLRHYQYVNLPAFVKKRMETKARLSLTNRQNGWGVPQCSGNAQDKIDDFNHRRQHAIKIPNP